MQLSTWRHCRSTILESGIDENKKNRGRKRVEKKISHRMLSMLGGNRHGERENKGKNEWEIRLEWNFMDFLK